MRILVPAMTDLIWTVIGIWLVFRIISAFKPKANSTMNSAANDYSKQDHSQKQKEAAKRSLEQEGDYIDYEEIK